MTARAGGANVLEREDARDVVTLRLNRPERLNALNTELLHRLVDALRTIPDHARAVVLRGNGDSFCAGYDLKEASERLPQASGEIRASTELVQEVTRAMRACEVPVIAVVHGYAVGGGCEFAISSDLVIAATNTKFVFPETEIGLSVTNGVTSILPKTVGPARAKELIFLGDAFSASDARAMGIVNRVVDEQELDTELAEMLSKLVRKTRLSILLAKRLIDSGTDADLATTLRREIDAAVEAELSGHAREAMLAFARRRRTTFLGP